MALIETWTFTVSRPGRVRAAAGWLAGRWVAVVSGTAVLALVGAVQLVNDTGWPSLVNDDEGTYMARAWAVLTGRGAHHSLANYTYWYDHPPLGWIQLAPLAWLTRAFHAGNFTSFDGRRIMVLYALASTVLVYLVARRLGASLGAGLCAMAIFGLSPLSLEYLRPVYLDGIGLPWLLAAVVLVLSPRRSLGAFAGAGACFAVACLSKETYLLWLPVPLWLVWQRSRPGERAMRLAAFGALACGLLALYPLYAALKGELLPGAGHVSLIGAIQWQLGQRSSSGSVLAVGSPSHALVFGWLRKDPYLLGGGLTAIPVAACFRRLRPIALGLLIPLAYVLHPGYLPAMFVVGALPFAALALAGTADALWKLDPLRRLFGARVRRHTVEVRTRLVWRAGLSAALATGALMAATSWGSADAAALRMETNTALLQAEQWVASHVPHRDPVLVDENVWTDLVVDGWSPDKVVSFWELGTDPEVDNRYRSTWRAMDYVVVSGTLRVNVVSSRLTDTAEAIGHSVPVASFGGGADAVQVRRVRPATRSLHLPGWLPPYALHVPQGAASKGAPK